MMQYYFVVLYDDISLQSFDAVSLSKVLKKTITTN